MRDMLWMLRAAPLLVVLRAVGQLSWNSNLDICFKPQMDLEIIVEEVFFSNFWEI